MRQTFGIPRASNTYTVQQQSDRFQHLFNLLKVNQVSFSKQLGVSQSFISRLIRGHNNISSELLKKIRDTYPDVNPVWLLSGDGEPFLSGKPLVVEEPMAVYSTGPTEVSILAHFSSNLKVMGEKWDMYNYQVIKLVGAEVTGTTVAKYFDGTTLPGIVYLLRFEQVTGLPLRILLTQYITPDQLPAQPVSNPTLSELMAELVRLQAQINKYLMELK